MDMFCEVVNLNAALARAKRDEAVGISIARLAGEEDCALFAARLPPGASVAPHYHSKGGEVYFIAAGKGEMTLGPVTQGDRVSWQRGFEVETGDCFSIAPGMAHRLKNAGREPLTVLFPCSPRHLGEDRVVVDGAT